MTVVKKVELKSSKNQASVEEYIAGLVPVSRSEQARCLDSLFQAATGLAPSMWGASIIGYGQYTYYRGNGDEGQFMATGFAMRKSGPVLYVLPGYGTAGPLLEQLGPHKLGKSCLYIKRVSDVNLDVVAQLIKQGLLELKERYAVDY